MNEQMVQIQLFVSVITHSVMVLNGEIQRSINYYGGGDFQKMVLRGTPMVDKSLWMKELMEDPKDTIVIARPRGFGKSINLSMLKHFLTVNGTSESLFKHLAISQLTDFCKIHQNKHPVLHLKFASFSGKTFDECNKHLTVIINNLFMEHNYVGQSSRLTEAERKNFTASYSGSINATQVPFLISKLMRLMRIHFGKKIVVLLEDHDVPIWASYSEYFQKEMFPLLRGIIENIFNDESLLKGVILGVTEENENLFSGLKNKGIYSVRHGKYAEHFGFLEAEVRKLVRDFNKLTPNIRDQLRFYYGGYRIGNQVVYNPWSVISCLKPGGKLGESWMKSFESPAVLNPIITTYGVVPSLKIEILLRGIDIRIVFEPDYSAHEQLFMNEDMFWTFLLQLGFFTIIHQEKNNRSEVICDIRFPNEEVRSAMLTAVEGYKEKYNVSSYEDFLNCFKNNDSEKAQTILDSYMKHSALFYFDHRLDRVASLLKGLEIIYGPSEIITDKDDYYLVQMNPDNPEPLLVLLIRATEIRNDTKSAESLIKSLLNNQIRHFTLFVRFVSDKEIYKALKVEPPTM